MKVRTDVEVVVGAVDQGFARVMERMDTQTKKNSASIGALQKTATQFIGGFLTFNFAKKVGEYIIDIGKAADKNTEFGRTFGEASKAFGEMKASADAAIGGLVLQFLPAAIERFKLLAEVIHDVGVAFGVVQENLSTDATKRLLVLQQQIDELNAQIAKAESGGRFATTGSFGIPVRQLNETEIAALRTRVEDLRQQFAALSHAQSTRAGGPNASPENITQAFVDQGGIRGFDLNQALLRPSQADAAAAEEAAKGAEKIARSQKKVTENTREQREEMLRNRDVLTAMADGWAILGQTVADTAGFAQNAVVQFGQSVATNLSDTLFDAVSGAKDAGEAFKEFGLGLVRQLGQIATSYLVAYVFKSLFFGGGGGVPSGVGVAGALHGGIFGGRRGGGARGGPAGYDQPELRYHEMAHGGVASGPSVVVYGEGSRKEAYVPLQDGRTIPVRIEGGAGSRGDTIVIYAMDSKSVVETLGQYGHVYRGAVHQGIARNGRDRGIFKDALR